MYLLNKNVNKLNLSFCTIPCIILILISFQSLANQPTLKQRTDTHNIPVVESNSTIQIAKKEENTPSFENWLKTFATEASQAGINNDIISNVLLKASFNETVIKLDQKQPYKTKTFQQYLNNLLPTSQIKKANIEYNKNKFLLTKIGKEYNVQPRFIVALWGIESRFGSNMGSFSIIDSLATLAYEGRRAEFFKKELINALRIIQNGHILSHKMKGSWAGAMGQTQFMPSSFLELAVDYDGDGKKDIWGTKADVFASIANYLSKRGWNDELTWGREVKLPKNFDTRLIDKNIEKNLKEWQSLGIRKVTGGRLPSRDDVIGSLIRPEDDKSRTFLIYSNYKTILKWNRSLYFATAVGILSDSIKN